MAKEAGAGTFMGAMLGLMILGFSFLWDSISTQVGLVVAISLPVSGVGVTGEEREGGGGCWPGAHTMHVHSGSGQAAARSAGPGRRCRHLGAARP